MMETVSHNSILAPPLFAFSRKVGIVSHYKPWEVTFNSKEEGKLGIDSGRELAAAGLESYVRQMVAQFALEIRIPILKGSPLNKGQAIKNMMSPSLRKRLIMVDCRKTIWSAVETYIKPLRQDIQSDGWDGDASPHGMLSRFTWGVYIMILGNKAGADVPINPRQMMKLSEALSSLSGLNAESRGRLAVMRGIFAAYRDTDTFQGLSFVPGLLAGQISERMDEMIEDAYFLEASHLRRLFGLRQNLTSVRRDLRLLTRFIAKKSPWARGITQVASQIGFVGSDAVKEAIQAITTPSSRRPPLCVDPLHYIRALGASEGESLWTAWPVVNGLRIAWWNPKDEKWM